MHTFLYRARPEERKAVKKSVADEEDREEIQLKELQVCVCYV